MAAESRFAKGECRSSPGHRHHPSGTDRMESGGEEKVWAQCQGSVKSHLTRPHVLLRVRHCSKSLQQSHHLLPQQPHDAVWEILLSPFEEEEPEAPRG